MLMILESITIGLIDLISQLSIIMMMMRLGMYVVWSIEFNVQWEDQYSEVFFGLSCYILIDRLVLL